MHDYNYTLERLNGLIYILAVEEGDIKERLIKALIEKWETRSSFPDRLKPYFDKIQRVVQSKDGNEYENAFQRSLYRTRLKTCCEVAKQIYDLKCMLEDHIEYSDK